ncbi:peptidase M15 [Microbacterium sp. Root166]|uniref:M15 family metallopeptidase n=1 Tax=Microbacterium sp. Root166 TaxID=1736478 RepID=UPI0006F40C04|nr:M15 family metallopeptidase [Microbacterium sp. Root166]KQZ85146.1 peptidase M15 [Microbacterium sp. Root166]
MTKNRQAIRRARAGVVLGALGVAAVITGTLAMQTASTAASAPSAPSSISAAPMAPPTGEIPRGGAGVLTESDGLLPPAVSVFDDRYPAVGNLEPALLAAVRQAATDAADEGVEFVVNSGWRSALYQDKLLRDAVSEYGSEEEAARWVATADTSAHVSGDAVDIGSDDAQSWLADHGSRYGLCRIYDNEPWHFELRPAAIDQGCPATYDDPTQDPRMQR